MFRSRFGTKWSREGPERLKNIYFVFMLELRALVKAAPYLERELRFYTGNEEVSDPHFACLLQLLFLPCIG